MDYLVYAYLQNGQYAEAARVIQELKSTPQLSVADAKIGYAATAMPVRYAVERQQWGDAAAIVPPPSTAAPQVIAIAVWARGLGLAHTGHAGDARAQAATLQQLQDELHKLGREYWASQVAIQRLEVLAWAAQAEGKSEEALALLRQAADTEDSMEKLPVTPGPIIPAREQLGDLLLQTKQPQKAVKEFQTSLANSPGRRGGERQPTYELAAIMRKAFGRTPISTGVRHTYSPSAKISIGRSVTIRRREARKYSTSFMPM
jgi:tetratricopeptide (TPR) repeat protein